MTFELDAVIEIPFGSMYKYEVDKKTGYLTIDRPLPAPLPFSYGYLNNTLAPDKDATDLVVIGDNPIYPLTRAKIILLGAFKCLDNGVEDDKMVGVVKGVTITDWQLDHEKQVIKDYLSTYKNGFVVLNFVDADHAYEIVMADVDNYLNGD